MLPLTEKNLDFTRFTSEQAMHGWNETAVEGRNENKGAVMKAPITRSTLAACAFAALVTPGAYADDPPTPSGGRQQQPSSADAPQSSDKMKSKTKTKSSATTKSDAARKLGMAEVMTITQNAMTHIAAADRALDQGKKAAARSALVKSEKELSKLYNQPALGPVMAELDRAIDSASRKGAQADGLDLAPLTTTVRSYQAYLDPSVSAGIERAKERAQSGDTKGTEEALRLARNRVAIDTAFIPVEDAYVRVVAAQHALDKGNVKQASRLLDSVPIIVSELQISQPLLPVRFNLHAAAEAAESGKWDQAETLLSRVDEDLQRLEKASVGEAQTTELASISDDVERLHQDVTAGKNPPPAQIRQLAQRIEAFGADESETDSMTRQQNQPGSAPQPADTQPQGQRPGDTRTPEGG